MPPAVEEWSLNHWTTRGVPIALFKIRCHLGEKIQELYKPRGSLVPYFCQQEQDVAFFTFQVLQFQCTRQRHCRSIRQAVLRRVWGRRMVGGEWMPERLQKDSLPTPVAFKDKALQDSEIHGAFSQPW